MSQTLKYSPKWNCSTNQVINAFTDCAVSPHNTPEQATLNPPIFLIMKLRSIRVCKSPVVLRRRSYRLHKNLRFTFQLGSYCDSSLPPESPSQPRISLPSKRRHSFESSDASLLSKRHCPPHRLSSGYLEGTQQPKPAYSIISNSAQELVALELKSASVVA